MANRELIALGTASQVPTRTRAHNAYFLRWDEAGLLFDPGEGAQRQFTLADVSVTSVDRVCITHFHGDHCLGVPGLIQRLSLDHCPHPVALHYPASGAVFLERMRYASIYYPDPALKLELCPVPERDGLQLLAETERYRLYSHALDHGVPAIGYRLEEKEKLAYVPEKLEALGIRGKAVGDLTRTGSIEIGGKRITREEVSVPKAGQAFALVMDTRVCPGALALARGADLLVMEATYTATDQALATDHGHCSSVDAARVAREAGVRRLAITHFSQRYESSAQHLEEARAIFADTVALEDLGRVAVPARA
jgi:ribonuclease Z